MVLILDTDPGVDDMMALLLLLAIPKSFEELRLISLTFGNCPLLQTLRNTLSMFSVIQRENKWRASKGWKPLTTQKPMVALGSKGPLDIPHAVDAEDVHGADGLAGIHSSNPEYDAPPHWEEYFTKKTEKIEEDLPFQVENQRDSWDVILDILREEPEGSVTIIAVGPLTNCARAAKKDPAAFSRVKQILSMGGAIRCPGNVTPTAEFNVYADPDAAAIIYALTSEHPEDCAPKQGLSRLPSKKPLDLKIFPLDLTERHTLYLKDVNGTLGKASRENPDSVFLKWTYTWMEKAFANYGRLIGVGPDIAFVHLHDPLTAAYVLDLSHKPGKWTHEALDVRVETGGVWSAGLTVADLRGRAKHDDTSHDYQKWLTNGRGNNVAVITDSPFELRLDTYLLEIILSELGPPTK